MSVKIDKTAIVHPRAKLGKGVIVGPYVNIAEDVIIGDNTIIEPHALIYDGARIGKNCHIFPGAIISTIPQDLKFNGEYTTVEIGNNVTIREYATINRGTTYHNKTEIHDNTLIMAYAHIAHDCIIRENVVIANAVNMAGHVEIGEYAVIGGMTAIHQFCRIGKHAMLSGASKVGQDVPPYALVGRDPLKYLSVNVVGLRRRGFTTEQINEIKEIYKILYYNGKNRGVAIREIQKKFPDSVFKDEIIDFISKSKRGIVRAYMENLDD